jgi:hypothetical protein
MSTTTNFKRSALVAVAALGLGVLSSVPSQAVVNSDALTVSATTAAQTTAETVTATNPTVTVSGLVGATSDSVTVLASLVSGPAGNTALPYLQLTETSTSTVNETEAVSLAYNNDLLTFVNPNTPISVSVKGSTVPAAISAKFKVFLGTSTTAAPTVAGTYVVKLTPTVSAGSTLNATAQTITITGTAAPALDTVASAETTTYVISAGDTVTTTNGDNAVDDVVYAPKTLSTNTAIRALIKVTQKNAAGLTAANESMTVVITGPGTIAKASAGAPYTATVAGTRALTLKNGDIVAVYSDGTAGVGVITFSTATVTKLAEEKVNFYGTIASVVATAANPVIGIGAASASVGNVAYSNTSAVTAVAKDSQGFTVCDSAQSLYLTSATTATISQSYAAQTTLDATTCTYKWSLTGVAAGTASLTVGTGSSAAATSNITAAPVSVRVASSSAASVTISFDKSTYAPGEAAIVSVKAVDSTGLLLAGQYLAGIWATGGITSDYALTGDTLTWTEVRSAAATSATAGTTAGVATYKVYMPQIDGKVTLKGTTGTGLSVVANQGVVVSASATVTSAGAQALAAVTALATTVASLKTLIVTLTNLVLKIQKKVKA